MTGITVLIQTAMFGCIQKVWTNVKETMCAVYVELSLLNAFLYLTKYVFFFLLLNSYTML